MEEEVMDAEDDKLDVKDETLSVEDDAVREDDVLREDDAAREGDVLREDDVMKEDDVVRENDVVSMIEVDAQQTSSRFDTITTEVTVNKGAVGLGTMVVVVIVENSCIVGTVESEVTAVVVVPVEPISEHGISVRLDEAVSKLRFVVVCMTSLALLKSWLEAELVKA